MPGFIHDGSFILETWLVIFLCLKLLVTLQLLVPRTCLFGRIVKKNFRKNSENSRFFPEVEFQMLNPLTSIWNVGNLETHNTKSICFLWCGILNGHDVMSFQKSPKSPTPYQKYLLTKQAFKVLDVVCVDQLHK